MLEFVQQFVVLHRYPKMSSCVSPYNQIHQYHFRIEELSGNEYEIQIDQQTHHYFEQCFKPSGIKCTLNSLFATLGNAAPICFIVLHQFQRY